MEVVILAIGAVVAVAAALEIWKYLDWGRLNDPGRIESAPYTARNTLLPIVGMAVFCGIITALSEGKA